MKHARQSNIPMVVDGVCNSKDNLMYFLKI